MDALNEAIEFQKKTLRSQLSIFYALRDNLAKGNIEFAKEIADELIRATKDCLKV